MNVAEYICNYLAKYHVRYVFGYPGASILPLMDAINKHPELNWILMRHESAAAFAASAQAKLSKHLSLCMASSGPGATNLITGIMDGELDHVPMLIITGLIPTIKHGLAHFQDIDQVTILKTCCGFSASGEHPAQIPQLLQSAVGFAIKNKRPAHLAIAKDIQAHELSPHQFQEAIPHYNRLHTSVTLMAPPPEAIDMVADTLNHADDIIIAVGPRAFHAGKEIEQLSEKLQAPMVCSFAGKGVINENHPNYFGVLGLFGVPANQQAIFAIKNAKTVLAFGIDDLVYFLTDKDINQNRDLIQFEPDVTGLSYQFVQSKMLLGRLDLIAKDLAAKVSAKSSTLLKQALHEYNRLKENEKKKKFITEPGTVHQEIFFKKLNPFINQPNTIIALDIGDCVVWAIEYLKLSHYQSILVSNRLGSMGFCLPALIAAKLEKPDHTVVGICGDGGLQMMLGELNTAVQEELNIIIIVFNNGILQRVIAQQHKAYGTILKNPDFPELAESLGATCISIAYHEEIEAKLHEAFSIKKGPVIIEVKCDPTVYAPMISSSELSAK